MLNVILNLLLFIVKLLGGKMCHSISVISDALNNLTDAVTTLLAWLGLKVSCLGAGENHPNGHGRFEWVIALISACCVIVIGWELLCDSLAIVKSPQKIIFNLPIAIILIFSIGIKGFMYLYNSVKSKEKNASSLKAIAIDCLSDALSTAAVLCSMVINHIFSINVDGYCGILVSVFIMYSGFKSFIETVDRIMGKSASEEKVDELTRFALENSDFDKIMNLQIEDYGYDRYQVSMTVVGKKGLDASQLLAGVSRLRCDIYEQYGYASQIMLEVELEKSAMIENYIDQVLSSISIPLQVLSLRICDAGEFLLAELDLGIDFFDSGKIEEIERKLQDKFKDMPSGYRMLTHIKLKAKSKAHIKGIRNHVWRKRFV